MKSLWHPPTTLKRVDSVATFDSTEKETQVEISLLLVLSPHTLNSRDWARPKPKAKDSALVSICLTRHLLPPGVWTWKGSLGSTVNSDKGCVSPSPAGPLLQELTVLNVHRSFLFMLFLIFNAYVFVHSFILGCFTSLGNHIFTICFSHSIFCF